MAATPWTTVAPGIRARPHPTRRHGARRDRYFTLRFSVNGDQVEEALGWASEGWTVERAQETLSELRRAKRTGEGPLTLRDRAEAGGRPSVRKRTKPRSANAGKRQWRTCGTATARKSSRSKTGPARPRKRRASGIRASSQRWAAPGSTKSPRKTPAPWCARRYASTKPERSSEVRPRPATCIDCCITCLAELWRGSFGDAISATRLMVSTSPKSPAASGC